MRAVEVKNNPTTESEATKTLNLLLIISYCNLQGLKCIYTNRGDLHEHLHILAKYMQVCLWVAHVLTF